MLTKIKFIDKNLSILILGSFGGRILGLLRDFFIILIFGVSVESDKIYYLLLFPDLFNNLLSWSMIVTIFLPQITKSNNRKTLFDFYKSNIEKYSVFLILFVSLLLVIQADGLLVEKLLLCWTFYFGIKFGFGLIEEQLNENFRSTSTANIYYNIGVITAVAAAFFNTILFAVIILLTTVIRYVISKKINRFSDFIIKNDHKNQNVTLRDNYGKLSDVLIAIICLSILGVNFTLDKFLISNFATDGILTSFSLAEKLFLLPFSILILPYLNKIYPQVSKINSISNQNFELLSKPIKLIFFLAIIQNIGTYIILFIFKICSLAETVKIEQVGKMLILMNLTILFYGIVVHLINLFIALNKLRLLSLTMVITFSLKFIFLSLFKSEDFRIIILSNLVALFCLTLLLLFFISKTKKT